VVTFIANGVKKRPNYNDDLPCTRAGGLRLAHCVRRNGDARGPNARARAEQIARQGGRRLKELRTARMGVVQINPLYSSATSWEGNNDNSSFEKTIMTTVSATFSLD